MVSFCVQILVSAAQVVREQLLKLYNAICLHLRSSILVVVYGSAVA